MNRELITADAADAEFRPGVDWRPNSKPQRAFFRSSAFEVLYGGAAGGGKSEALLVNALRWVEHPAHHAILFRRTYPELELSIIPRSFSFYLAQGGKYNAGRHQWTFPSGARITFGHLEREVSVHQYQSAEFTLVEFDELTTFTEAQYIYLFSRVRTTSEIPPRVRAASNPGGVGAEWVAKRFGPWASKKYKNDRGLLDPERDGKKRWYIRNPAGESIEVERDTPHALSRTFIKALPKDNPALRQDYSSRLKMLDPVTRAQLEDGDWDIRAEAGKVFNRLWYRIVQHAPSMDEIRGRVRWWDRASSTSDKADWTVGALWSRGTNGLFYVEDVIRFRGSPGEVESMILSCARTDGVRTTVGLSHDPGSAGDAELSNYVRLLAGFDVYSVRETGDKFVRAKPHSAQAFHRMVVLVQGAWNDEWLEEHQAFPTPGVHDDQVDSSSNALNYLVLKAPVTLADSAAFNAAIEGPRVPEEPLSLSGGRHSP